MKTDLLSLSYYFYIFIAIMITIFNRKSIWKGICGGNGAAQPDELVKAVIVIIFYFDVGLIVFLHEQPDYILLAYLLGMLGLQQFITNKSTKQDKNENSKDSIVSDNK